MLTNLGKTLLIFRQQKTRILTPTSIEHQATYCEANVYMKALFSEIINFSR